MFPAEVPQEVADQARSFNLISLTSSDCVKFQLKVQRDACEALWSHRGTRPCCRPPRPPVQLCCPGGRSLTPALGSFFHLYKVFYVPKYYLVNKKVLLLINNKEKLTCFETFNFLLFYNVGNISQMDILLPILNRELGSSFLWTPSMVFYDNDSEKIHSTPNFSPKIH